MEHARFLATPGPTEISTRVLKALVMPAIEPGDQSFVQVMDETAELLKAVFKTENDVALFPGSGRVAVEYALASVIEPGDRMLCLVNGVFGKWMKETAEPHPKEVDTSSATAISSMPSLDVNFLY